MSDVGLLVLFFFFFFKQKTAYEITYGDWSSDVCSSDLWEGSLKRDNGNIGTWSGQTVMWYGVYGLTPKINIMASVPYAANKVSGGTLMPMSGLQDAMVSGKY